MENIVISNLCKSFGENKVLVNLSACFEGAKVNTIMAASGVGKTTLLRIMTNLEKADGGDITGLNGKKISAVFQEDRLCENLSALTNIKFVSGKDNETILKALADIGLKGFEKVPVSTLSGGMKRRVAILRALLSDYDVLFLDEPFKGLDEETKQNVITYVKNNVVGKTVVLITHIKEEAQMLNTATLLEL